MVKVLRARIAVSLALVGLAFVIGIVGVGLTTATRVETAYTGSNLIRLHILANSNSPMDQDLKLQVRDAVLSATTQLFSSVVTKEDARQYLVHNWALIRETALTTISENGFAYDVTLELGTYRFPERNYGGLTVPAGHYDALRIVIGEGSGSNWWCVLFPPLCFVSLEEEEHLESLAVASSHLAEGDVEFRWKFLENLAETNHGRQLQAWWQMGIEVAETLASPLFSSK